jgi:hypothetical protein
MMLPPRSVGQSSRVLKVGEACYPEEFASVSDLRDFLHYWALVTSIVVRPLHSVADV